MSQSVNLGGYGRALDARRDGVTRRAIAALLLCTASIAGLVASPLFQTIGPAEIFYAATMMIPLMSVGIVGGDARPKDNMVLVLLGLYLLSILISSMVGALKGGLVSGIFRSVVPLILPIFVWLSLFRPASVNLMKLGFLSFVVAGLGQAFYIFYLYATNVAVALPINGIVARVTYFDLRPVQPYLLIALAAGAALIVRANRARDTVAGLALFAIGLAAVLFTQTRTFMVIAGLQLPMAVALVFWSRAVPGSVKQQALFRLAVSVGMAFFAGIMLLASGRGANLIESILARFAGAMDRDDWAAAVATFDIASLPTVLFGAGIGSTFDVYGEQVTFVHNGFIYHLLFAGIVGLLAYTAFVGYVGWRLLNGYLRTGTVTTLAMLLGYLSLIIYTVTFAIYKWPTYNTMIGFFALAAASLASARRGNLISSPARVG
ncbi:hypothetical protein [Brevundimonas sp.]|uniref:hypothetical protein n=1 Tax=Brevundimonas sp. TaxID=1871086 RepID=UPI0035B375E6